MALSSKTMKRTNNRNDINCSDLFRTQYGLPKIDDIFSVGESYSKDDFLYVFGRCVKNRNDPKKQIYEVYLIDSNLAEEQGWYGNIEDVNKARFFQAVVPSREVNLIIPVSYPYRNQSSIFKDSLEEALEEGKTNWIKRVYEEGYFGYERANENNGLYSKQPLLPKKSLDDMLDGFFDGKVIDSLNHPVVASFKERR